MASKNKKQKYIDKLVEEGLREKEEGKTENLENFLKRAYPKLYKKYKR